MPSFIIWLQFYEKIIISLQKLMLTYNLKVQYIMSVLFTLSNIAVPFLILSYTSLVQIQKNNSFFAAKWLILITYTFLSNLLFYFMDDNKIFLIFDLVIKLAIVFIPEVINQSLEKIIASLHLQLLFDLARSIIVPQFYFVYTLILQFSLNKMNLREQNQFKTVIINVFQRMSNPAAAPISDSTVLKKYPQFENTGVSCDILTLTMLNNEIRQKQLYRLQLSQKSIESSLTHHSSAGNLKQSQSRQQNQPIPDNIASMKKKTGYTIQKSNTDIGLNDEDDKGVYEKSRNSKVVRNSKVQENVRYKSPDEKPSFAKEQSEPSMILNKLDVSEYSDMFEDEEENADRKLVTKVQTIIEIAGMSTARLQIYNIELYSNSDIRIVSLYGRQFQRHKLVSMKPLKHGYYELKLQNGKVQNRKVKFRGSFQPFLKYLQTQS